MARFLVIEDDPESLELLTYLLEAHGHSVARAQTVASAVAILRSEPIDLVVTDMNLPGASGADFLNAVRALPALARTPVVAVTARAGAGERERILAHGFDGYLSKPIDARSFVEELVRHLPDARGG